MSKDGDHASKALSRFGAASIGSFVAEILTLPIDITKVRLQLQHTENVSGPPKYRNFGHAGLVVAREEGAAALWKGIQPALLRQISYTGLSLVLYEPIRDTIAGTSGQDDMSQIPFWKRLLAGGTAGGTSIALVNPTDVVKTQMQGSSEALRISPIVQRIYATEGLVGFWAGVGPNVGRCFIGNACELGCYDQAKTVSERGLSYAPRSLYVL